MMKMNWMLIVSMVAAIGCGEPLNKNPDPDPDPDPYEFDDVTFVATNTGVSSVFLDLGINPLTIYHGDDAYVPGGSCADATSARPSSEGAPAPSRSNSLDAAPASLAEEFRPGANWERVWNGVVLGDGPCPNLADLEGEELVVEFCYATNFQGLEWDRSPVDLQCARQQFVLGETSTVEIDLELKIDQSGSIPLTIENGSEASIFVQLSDNCGSSTWYTVQHGEETIGLPNPCGPCDCSEGSECFVGCDAACAAPEVAEISPGEALTAEFPLAYRKMYDEGTHQCTQLQYVPIDPLTATICYGSGVDEFEEGWGQVIGERCEQIQFTAQDEEVRLVATEVSTDGL